jgi:hypothetical protein
VDLGSESETCVGSRVRLVGAFISFEKNFYRPHSLPLSGSPYRSFKALCSRNSYHNACSACTSLRRARGTLGRRSPCSSCEMATSGTGGAMRDVDASAPCAGPYDITHPSDRNTSTSSACSRAAPDDPLDRPLLGAESPPAGAFAVSRPPADWLPKRAHSRPW